MPDAAELVAILLRPLFALLAIALVAAPALPLIWLARRPWWPSLVFQIRYRPEVVVRRLWVLFLAGVLVFATLFGIIFGLYAAIIVWILFAPGLVAPRAARAAWQRDNLETRAEARAVRNRLRERLGEPELPDDQPWPQYIIDVALARKQRAYRPPGADF